MTILMEDACFLRDMRPKLHWCYYGEGAYRTAGQVSLGSISCTDERLVSETGIVGHADSGLGHLDEIMVASLRYEHDIGLAYDW